MTNVMTVLAILEIVWVIGLSVWIVLERRSPVATLAWILALGWLPLVGIGVYMLIGPRRLHGKRRRYKAARARLAEAAHAMRADVDITVLPEQVGTALRQFIHLTDRLGEGPPMRTQSLEVLGSGDACYAALEKAIREARHHVHLEYYIWEPDQTGSRLRDLLCEKARAGVHVRLLVDAIGSSRLGCRFLRPLRKAGAEVAFFNRTALRIRKGLVNFRTHRKIVVCDGKTGFTGGINVCDLHSARVAGARAWRDTHLRLEGPPVGWLQLVFLEDWHFATGGAPSSAEYFPPAGTSCPGPWVQIIASGPDRDVYAVHHFYFQTS